MPPPRPSYSRSCTTGSSGTEPTSAPESTMPRDVAPATARPSAPLGRTRRERTNLTHEVRPPGSAACAYIRSDYCFLGALTISGITLWRTQFARFRLIVAGGPIRLRQHAMTNSGDEWLLPHLAVTLGFTNGGSVPGRILDIRAVVKYPALPINNPYEVFHCIGEFDTQAYEATSSQRLRMMGSRIRHFTPFVILPRETETRFLVFSKRWDKPVRQKQLLVEVQIRTDKSQQWVTVETWEHKSMTAKAWAYLESGSSIHTSASGSKRYCLRIRQLARQICTSIRRILIWRPQKSNGLRPLRRFRLAYRHYMRMTPTKSKEPLARCSTWAGRPESVEGYGDGLTSPAPAGDDRRRTAAPMIGSHVYLTSNDRERRQTVREPRTCSRRPVARSGSPQHPSRPPSRILWSQVDGQASDSGP